MAPCPSRPLRLLALLVAIALLPGAAVAAVEPPADEALPGDPVRFETQDGVTISGNLVAPAGGLAPRGAIVFVHEPFRTSRDWAYMAEKMAKKGFFGLIFDLRGHGESTARGDEVLDREIFGDEDFAAMVHDVAAAVKHVRGLPGVGADQVHLAGADLGGSVAVLHAVVDPQVRSVALLSPGLGYDGVNLFGKIAEVGKRPLLFVYSSEDSYSAKSTGVFEKEARGGHHTQVYYGVGHGTKMLSREPELENLLTAWFLGTILTAEGRTLADTGKPMTGEKGVQTALDEDAERKRLEEQRKAAADSSQAVPDDEKPKRHGSN